MLLKKHALNMSQYCDIIAFSLIKCSFDMKHTTIVFSKISITTSIIFFSHSYQLKSIRKKGESNIIKFITVSINYQFNYVALIFLPNG